MEVIVVMAREQRYMRVPVVMPAEQRIMKIGFDGV
jgi:hypothetical protein